MLKEIFFPLVGDFSFLNIFQYISFRAAYAAITALLISFVAGPSIILMLKKMKLGQEIREDGPQTHLSKAGTPTMGGLLIVFSVFVSVLLWQDLHSAYTWLAMGALLGLALLGFADDYLKISRKNSDGLSPRLKMTGQFLVAAAVSGYLTFRGGEQATYLYLPFFKNPVMDLGLLYWPFGILVITGFSNAVNLTDGLDGLATGLVIMALLAFTLLIYITGRVDYTRYLQIPYVPGVGELTIMGMALLGACVGFLWFNCHPAEVMMGDTGSLSLGGVLGAMALILKKEILLVIIGGVFVIEVLSVILQVACFKRTGKRIFRMAPVHHHFELSGWKESKVVTRLWILGGMFALLGLSTLKIR